MQAYIEHRLGREAQIMARLKEGPQTIPQMVAKNYADTPLHLHAAAGRSMLAHLIQMVKDGRVKTEDGRASDRFDLPALGDTDMDLKLAGKTVLITGGSRGIGFACAMAFAGEGCAVHIASRSKESLEVGARQDPRPPQRAGRDPCRRLLQGRHGALRWSRPSAMPTSW